MRLPLQPKEGVKTLSFLIFDLAYLFEEDKRAPTHTRLRNVSSQNLSQDFGQCGL